jgi:hypothetical protein
MAHFPRPFHTLRHPVTPGMSGQRIDSPAMGSEWARYSTILSSIVWFL